jgi:site-specific recombinase XerD
MDGINRKPVREFDGKDLLWLIDEYMKESSSRVKEITINNYGWSLGYFIQWWGEVGPAKEWIINRTTFQEYIRWLEQQHTQFNKLMGYNTLETSLRRLRQVFKWAYKEGFFNRDYGTWIPACPGKPPLRTIPGIECIEKLFRAASETAKPTRNCAILAILIGTGVRRAECVSIDIEHIEFNTDRPGGRIIIPHGKGDKPRVVVFDETTQRYIAEHLAFLAEQGITSGPFICGHSISKRMLRKSLNTVIDTIVEAAGLTDVIHGPHDFRRMFATYWSRKQRGQGFAQPLSLQMGHSEHEMTLLYCKQDLSDIEATFISPMETMRPRASELDDDDDPIITN